MIILGLGGILSDAACALLRDGELIAAVEEKKIARRYTTGELPQQAIAASPEDCARRARQGRLRCAGSAVHEMPPIRPCTCRFVRSFRTHGWFWWSIIPRMQRRPGIHRGSMKLQFLLSIAPATFAAELDGKRTAMASGRIRSFSIRIRSADLYGRVTELLGFQSNADEHKVQWLSMSGDDRFVRVFEEMIAWETTSGLGLTDPGSTTHA